jgi:hypothetical protein
MGFIAGFLIGLITFPGVIIHEIAHRFFCDLTGTPVYEVRYFEPFEDPAGYVIHGEATSLRAAFFISMGPLIVNTLVCMVFCLPYAMASHLGADPTSSATLLGWVGLSAGVHAFPSNQDASSFSEHVQRNNSDWLYYALWPFRILIFLANLLRIVWFDAIYAVAVASLLPSLFAWIL